MSHVRALGDSDHPEVLEIAAQISGRRLPLAQFNWPPASLREELRATRGLVWEEAGRLGGFLCYRDLGDALEISVLATAEGFTGRGVQTAIIQYLQIFAASQHKSVLLEVHEANAAAVSLYRKCGFGDLRLRPRYYADGAAARVLIWSVAIPGDKAGC